MQVYTFTVRLRCAISRKLVCRDCHTCIRTYVSVYICGTLFRSNLAGEDVMDVLSRRRVSISEIQALNIHFVVGGFSCKDASQLKDRRGYANWARSKNRSGSTAATFFGCKALLEKLNPTLGVLENVFGSACGYAYAHVQNTNPTYVRTYARAYAVGGALSGIFSFSFDSGRARGSQVCFLRVCVCVGTCVRFVPVHHGQERSVTMPTD